MQDEELAPSLLVDWGAMDHGEGPMIKFYQISCSPIQDAEQFFKSSEGGNFANKSYYSDGEKEEGSLEVDNLQK